MAESRVFATRRILWAGGVGIAGFLIGGIIAMTSGSVAGLLWGGCIGYGIGSIFDQRHATKWLVVYWSVILALIGPLFGLIIGLIVSAKQDYSVLDEVIWGGIGAAVGILLGFTFGSIHMRRLARGAYISPNEQPKI